MAVKGKGKQVASSSSSSAKRTMPFGDEAEGSSVAAARASKRRRPGVLQFVDDAALETDFDDPETDDQDADNDFLDDSKAQNDLKGIGKPHQLPFVLKEEELSADELEELIKDRYRQGSKLVVYDEDSKEHDVGITAVDSPTDPTIWRVKCMVGRERQMAFCFMQKYVDLSNLGTKMQIISAFALDHVKGYVFVEAEKACDISEACKGFCNIYASRVSLVARSEVPHLLSTRNKPCEASKGSWVRLKSGKYKGDLAQVVSVDDGRKTVMIKLVPRVDLQAISKKLGGGISLKHAPVPAPRLINSHELEEFRPHIEIKRDRQTGDLFEVLDGLMLKDGYLYKKVSIGSLIYWGVKPSDAELLKFSKTSKDEDEDLDWVSTIYVDRKRKHIAEELDHKAANIKEDVFNLHDLVLFGRKDFGVIIAIEKDGLRLLKGGMEGYEVATIRKEDIKGGCVDKMFTALDRHMKTISINDIVRVTEGPMQGKQGTVKHMYKGSLFVLDESETKHSAFFCARSNSCENIKEKKESIGSFGEDLGETSAPSFPQSPIKSYEQDYSSRESGKHRQSDREQMFSIGQTLRISKGPLKGYLCRVVRIYRSDVTVKLDSLVKIITVDAKFLSVPTRKRDDSAAAASDLFGASEMPSIVSLSVGGNGPQVDRSSWDIELPSFGSDTWQPFSSSTLARDNDHKTDKELESDPWGSKVTSGVGSDACHSDKPLDSWGKAAGSSGGQSSAWHKTAVDDKTIGAIGGQVENSQKDPDNWSNKALNNASCGTSAWEKATLPKNAAAGSWDTENSRGGVILDPSDDNDDVNISIVDDGCNSLKSSGGADGWDGVRTNYDKGKAVSLDQSSSRANAEVLSNEKLNNWGAKGKEATAGDSTWGKATKHQEKSGSGSHNWGSSIQSQGKDGAFKSEGHSGGWDAAVHRTRSSLEVGSHASNWGNSKDKREAESGGWNKSEISINIGTNTKESQEWGQPFSSSSQSQEKGVSKDQNQAGGWDAAVSMTHSSVEVGGHASSWDKGKSTRVGQYDDWGNKEKSKAEKGGWNIAGTSSHIPSDSWGKSKCSVVDHSFSWNKGEKEESERETQTDSWNKPRNSEGSRGFGRGSWGGRNAGDLGQIDEQDSSCNRSTGNGGAQQRSWGTGVSENESGGDRDQGSNWNRQRYGSGGFRGRGRDSRGRGGRGQDDNWQNSTERGNWGSGRGRGGDHNESGDARDSFCETRAFGRGRNQGRGWGRGQNDKQSFGDGTSPKVPSGWSSGQGAGWNKPDSSSRNEKAAGTNAQPDSWKNSSGWNASSWHDKNPTHHSYFDKDINAAEETRKNAETCGVQAGRVKDQADGHQKEESGWDQASARKGSNRIDGWEKAEQPNSDSGGMGVKERTKTGKQPDDSGDVMGNLDRLSSADLTDRSAGDVSGWEKGTSTKVGQVNAAQEVAGSNNRNAWDSKGKMINEEDGWGKAAHLPEKITAEPDSGNTNSSRQWNTAASRQLSSAKQQGDQAGWNNWEKPTNKGIAESSGWNNAGTSCWSKPTSSGGDHESSWSKPRNFEGGRGFGQGRGRSFGESGNRNQDSNWKKPSDRDGYHGSNWGKGMDINSDSAGSTGRESNWNKQRDFDGDRGTSWGRGRGRFNARGGNGWRPQGDEEDSKVSGRGGRNGAGNNWKDNDGTRPSGHGRGDGWSQSSGWSHSSDRNNNPANPGGQIVPRNEGSSWGNDRNTGRDGGRNGAGNNWKENDGTKPSSHGGGSGWSQSSNRTNEPANSGGQTVPRNEGSRWGNNQNTGRDGGCNGSGNSWKENDGTKTAGGSSSWSKSSDWGNHRESPGDQTIPRNEGSSWGNDQSKLRNEGPSLDNNDQNTGWEKTAGKWGETKGSTGGKGGW